MNGLRVIPSRKCKKKSRYAHDDSHVVPYDPTMNGYIGIGAIAIINRPTQPQKAYPYIQITGFDNDVIGKEVYKYCSINIPGVFVHHLNHLKFMEEQELQHVSTLDPGYMAHKDFTIILPANTPKFRVFFSQY